MCCKIKKQIELFRIRPCLDWSSQMSYLGMIQAELYNVYVYFCLYVQRKVSTVNINVINLTH